MTQTQVTVHASAVTFGSHGMLITGASGSGKSSLSLQLMALGAVLVGDDRLVLTSRDNSLWAEPVPSLAGMIEARGVGVLQAEPHYPAKITICIDLDTLETERIPPTRSVTFLDVSVRCLNKVDNPAFPAAILQYLKGGLAKV